MLNPDGKNIIIINDFAYVEGGASSVALSSAIGLAKLGFHVTLFAAVKPVMQDLIDNGVNVILTDQYDILSDNNRLRAAVQGIWNFKAARLLEDYLEQIEPSETIVHLHIWVKSLSSSLIPKIIRKKVKLICTLNDYFIACPNGGFFNYKKNKICDLKPLSWRCALQNCDARNYTHKVWRFIRQCIQKKIGMIPAKINNFITVSEFNKNILKSYLPSDCNCFTIPNLILSHYDNPIAVERK